MASLNKRGKTYYVGGKAKREEYNGEHVTVRVPCPRPSCPF
jgi:hypothetical protein